MNNVFKIENFIITILLVNQEKLNIVKSIVSSDMFLSIFNRTIYDSILEMYELKKEIDYLTLEVYLKENDKMDLIGDKKYKDFINTLYKVDVFNIVSYSYILLENSLKRKVLEYSKQNINYIEKDSKNVIDIINNTIEYLIEIRPRIEVEQKNSDSIVEYIRKVNEGLIKDIPTGFASIDNIMGGFGLGDMNIIAGRSKIGKTTFVSNIIYNQAFLLDINVRFYSLEMKRETLLIYLVSKHIQADRKWITAGTLTPAKYQSYLEFMDILDNKGLTIIENMYDINEIKNDIINCKEKIIYIDYNELIEIRGIDDPINKYDKIAKVFTKLAKETNKSINIIHQFRQFEPKDNIFPKAVVSHINYKAGVKDAAKILLVDGVLGEKVRDIIIGYNRYGDIGEVELYFNGLYSTFSEVYI